MWQLLTKNRRRETQLVVGNLQLGRVMIERPFICLYMYIINLRNGKIGSSSPTQVKSAFGMTPEFNSITIWWLSLVKTELPHQSKEQAGDDDRSSKIPSRSAFGLAFFFPLGPAFALAQALEAVPTWHMALLLVKIGVELVNAVKAALGLGIVSNRRIPHTFKCALGAVVHGRRLTLPKLLDVELGDTVLGTLLRLRWK